MLTVRGSQFNQFQIQVTGGDVGRCVAEFVVNKENLNQGGGLHGGFTATIVDDFTTYALITKDCKPGVTVDLHVRLEKIIHRPLTLVFFTSLIGILNLYCSYLKGAREGDTVVIDATAVKTGKTLAYLECELRNKDTGQILAKGSQTKYIA